MDTDGNAPQADERPSEKKYIRTFAGDMATAKRAGTSEPAAAALPPAPPSKEAPPQKPPPVPLWDTNAREAAREKVRNQIAFDEAHAIHRETERPAPPIERAEEMLLNTASPLHTYADDFSQKVKEEQASPATVLAAEQDAAARGGATVEAVSPAWNWFAIGGGVVLLVLGGVGIYYGYTTYQAQHKPVVLAPVISARIFAESEELVGGEGPTMLTAMQQSLERPLTPGTIRHLASPSATTTRKSIFVALDLPAPNILVRNVQGAGSMAGVIATEGTQSLFFILSVSSYSDTFAGMLQWEPRMQKDMETLFPPYPQAPAGYVSASATSTEKVANTASSTPAHNTAPTVYVPTFRDEVAADHDVRVLKDAEGRSLIIYGYWNNDTLIIARTGAAFTEIVDRLARVRTQ
ncbi:hypothetical protein COU19_02535 [Candidatus Kaiserbacteria bacterium CG10_big_fil_rev_8_21_14_0_10_56_12]|uniref:Uncharacterized protein n=1 Tax=Candidatus Kaiserbacteria bacterium CG10_big_fil_rev_8_21_14_0_10_56_12 TaxID=1974611 RepID=A0A2H0U9I5_9BACT|nr:MAG: hypothetical protein COU19_02535 [Candidatus Kaiserbacteria bacterium CG10_big_fil_rev_8_21_14_0_10_56_12]